MRILKVFSQERLIIIKRYHQDIVINTMVSNLMVLSTLNQKRRASSNTLKFNLVR